MLSSLISTPTVSVLIAARNEEANIADCIAALVEQSYPLSQFDIWIGNDNSSDGTRRIVEHYQSLYANINLLDITYSKNGLSGKANVLSFLTEIAKGKIFLFTDADVFVNKNWIQTFVNHFAGDLDFVSGIIGVHATSSFGKLQNADWISYMITCYKSFQKQKPVTALGGNMAIRSQVLRSIGGYENIPFSVTEDYELFRSVHEAGYRFATFFSKDILVFTHPVNTFAELLKQRRRWITSSHKRNWFSNVEFHTESLYLPLLILLGVLISPWLALGILLALWFYDIFILTSAFRLLQMKFDIGLFFHLPYSLFCNFIYFFFIFKKSPIEWKGRIYDH